MASGQRFAELLEALSRHAVDFMVVGATAAVLEGAPLTTFDLDVVVDPDPSNRERLLAALEEIGAAFFDPVGRKILPTAERLEKSRVNLLETSLGRLDVMREIGHGQGWGDLLPRSHEIEVLGSVVRILDLAAIIETKEAAGRPKDLAALPLLRETLRLKQERASRRGKS